MKKLSEKSFRALKVVVLVAMVTACGLYYVLFVDGEMPKTMETTSHIISKISKEATTKAILENTEEDEFIIEVEPVDDVLESEEKKDDVSTIDNDGKININIASSDELQTLKNIGPVVASNIISYRKEYGDFSSIEDIKNVKGIGDAKYNYIKDFIYVK